MKTKDVLSRIDDLPWVTSHGEFYRRLAWWELNVRLPPRWRLAWFRLVQRHGVAVAVAGRLYALVYNAVWRLRIIREVFRKKPRVRLL